MIREAVMTLVGMLGLRDTDVLLVSFPRSGNTWVRFFFFQLLDLEGNGSDDVTLQEMDETMPVLGRDTLFRPWKHEVIPRIVKAHRRHLPFFQNARSILLVRDPRDVTISYHHYLRDHRGERVPRSLGRFIQHPRYGLRAWFKHYISWRDEAGLLVRYEDLLSDPHRSFDRLARFVEADVSDRTIREAVDRSSFEAMQRAETGSSGAPAGAAERVVREGRAGQWKERFDAEMLAYYRELKVEFGVDLY